VAEQKLIFRKDRDAGQGRG